MHLLYLHLLLPTQQSLPFNHLYSWSAPIRVRLVRESSIPAMLHQIDLLYRSNPDLQTSSWSKTIDPLIVQPYLNGCNYLCQSKLACMHFLTFFQSLITDISPPPLLISLIYKNKIVFTSSSTSAHFLINCIDSVISLSIIIIIIP